MDDNDASKRPITNSIPVDFKKLTIISRIKLSWTKGLNIASKMECLCSFEDLPFMYKITAFGPYEKKTSFLTLSHA